MALSWNEIRSRALEFSKAWENETKERAEKDTFWNEFFNVFGKSRRSLAVFERSVKKLNENQGFIDLFWKGTLLVEHKSRGKNLDAAFEQATDYFYGLEENEIPKYVLVSDFENFRLYNLDEKTETSFQLKDLYKNIKLFGFIAGYQKRTFKDEDPVNIQAAYMMGKLHDQLKDIGYTGHNLEVYLVRLLFCLFADDTSIFEKDSFHFYLEEHTRTDGSDLAMHLANIFNILNTPKGYRLNNLPDELLALPYVNGRLFEEPLPFAQFDKNMRKTMLDCCALDWGLISPAIFGAMFQSIMNQQQRRELGAHYTSEKNILKLIKPLFLDELWKEFEKVKNNKRELQVFHKKLGDLTFLDPACGCGNFLVITYRELRLLELEVLREIHKGQYVTNLENIIWVNVDQFYGIEIDEWPARIAEVALWLMDHQMNMRISEEFGEYFSRLPLTKSATIVNGNALRMDWDSLINASTLDVTADETNIFQVAEPIPHYGKLNVYTTAVNISKGQLPTEFPKMKGKVNYIFGNPPFLGKAWQSGEQKNDMKAVFHGVKGAGVLDFVAAWYIKAAEYIQNTNVKVAFVSTNSIAQGEQVGILWNEMFNKYNVNIHFAHRTFNWTNEARAKAAVHVVIIGFANFSVREKSIYEYTNGVGEPDLIQVKNINPYLVEGDNLVVLKRKKPICKIQEMKYGSMPNEGGFLLMNEQEKLELIKVEPKAEKWIKRFMMGEELIKGTPRYCLWLKNVSPDALKEMPAVLERIQKVMNKRISSTRSSTKELANYPHLFGEIRQPNTNYIGLPRVSSERRKYIPMAIFSPDVIAGDKVYTIADANIYNFGILTSVMHMTWMRLTCGRMKSDYSYSNTIVYNNFPWPKNPSKQQKKMVENCAQQVLDARSKHHSSSLTHLYDPLTMPKNLIKAHLALDKAVDKCYRGKGFSAELQRIEFLFKLYKEYIESES